MRAFVLAHLESVDFVVRFDEDTPAKLIEAVRLMAVRKQGANYLKPEDIPSLIDEDTPGQLLMSALRKYCKS